MRPKKAGICSIANTLRWNQNKIVKWVANFAAYDETNRLNVYASLNSIYV